MVAYHFEIDKFKINKLEKKQDKLQYKMRGGFECFGYVILKNEDGSPHEEFTERLGKIFELLKASSIDLDYPSYAQYKFKNFFRIQGKTNCFKHPTI